MNLDVRGNVFAFFPDKLPADLLHLVAAMGTSHVFRRKVIFVHLVGKTGQNLLPGAALCARMCPDGGVRLARQVLRFAVRRYLGFVKDG